VIVLTSIYILDVDVLIVGAGPSGASTALFLAKYGIASLVISRHRSTANTPRAHIFNQRAMEALRDAGLEERLKPMASDKRNMMHTSWLRSLDGEEYGRVYAWGNRPEVLGKYERASPCTMCDLPQSVVEPVLVQEAVSLGATVRFSTELVSFEDNTGKNGHGKIEVLVRDQVSGEEYTIATRYLVGADGARSRVLDIAGIEIQGKQLNDAFNVHIKADLTKFVAHRPGSLNWVLNPDAPDWSSVGNFRMVRPWNEWVVSMHPSLRDGNIFEPTTQDILNRLHQLIGDVHKPPEEQVQIEILSAFRWTINAQVAPTWQRGNVLCIGDAVHRHPPINGLGSNTCIGDAFNLSWKLAYVLKGYASPAILETLTTERKPVGDGVVKRANDGMRDHRALWNLLGLSQDEREASTSLMELNTVQGADLRARVRAAMDKTDDEVNALGIQMNQVYARSRISQSDDDAPPPDFIHLDPLKDVFISTFPGYHLPHVWLAKDGQSERISTLDLVGKGAFTLLTGIGGEAWKDATVQLASDATRQLPPLRAFSIGFRQDYLDVYGDWTLVRGVADDGVVLVRPDHFVAWRSPSMVPDPQRKLGDVLSSILGL
jgi:2-polyprenyl-6-methoxyphenol hydroxylase-like FAD-dependent oxidoreductase